MKGDVLSILEAAYAPAADADAWLGHALDALVPHFDRGYGVFAHRFHVVDGHLSRGPLTPRSKAGVVMDSLVRAGEASFETLRTMPPAAASQLIRRLYPCAPTVGWQTDLLGTKPGELMSVDVQGKLVADALGIVASEPSGHGSVFFTPGVRGQLSVQTRAVWLRIATHLAAGHRLARDPQARTDAVLDPSGRLEHAEGDATIREERVALSSATAAIDRARGRLRRSHPQEALALWQSLVRGRWSLVEQFDHDGRRFVVARRNAPQVRAWSTLTPREAKVLAYAAEGQSHKMIAYTLGLSISTVGADLTRAATKVGARSRLDLVAMYRGAHADPHLDPAEAP